MSASGSGPGATPCSARCGRNCRKQGCRACPAGLHLLVTFPALNLDDTGLAERIHRAGVLVHPLSWHRQRPGPPGLVLGYAAHTPDQLREAARRIARAVPA